MSESRLLEGGYDPAIVEKEATEKQQQAGVWSIKGTGTPYTIVLPPPNVTGSLHMGHALNHTIQDILIRYARMGGAATLWQPGTDHAGIATQNVVEKELAAQGKSREELGRSEFLEQVWNWKEKSGNRIVEQQKRLGESCEWDRARFTMDEGLSKAVREVFVSLYEEDLIYRGNYMINWCPRCGTALSDLEVEMRETEGALYHMHYPHAEGEGYIEVATTRPETYMGDTAVAIHPDDDRFPEQLSLKLPFMDRVIPVIRDEHVDREYGTGCLKVTPAHDFNDFDIGQRHSLEVINVMTDTAVISAEGGPYAGLTREECRKEVVRRFEEGGLMGSVEPMKHMVGHCYRCDTVVEPRISRQWFVKVAPLAKEAIAAVKDGRTRFYPENWSKTYFEWMENIRDWCISRQIWWGHRIPVWTCADCDHEFAAKIDPETCPSCGSTKLTQETDVLDTWFSSALWPFSTLGWPENNEILRKHYPTNVLVTGFDILFFWVARMMMMGLKFMGDVPFRHVYIHALVRDEHGHKMSKTRGNVIDPLDIIEEHGADALRFTLTSMTALGRDIKLSIPRIEGYRHFCNKIWNAVRFCQLQDGFETAEGLEPSPTTLSDRWLQQRLAVLSATVESSIDNYRLNDLANGLYNFVWNDFCDWYLESVKHELKQDGADRSSILNHLKWALGRWLALVHPVMPYLTDYLWEHALGWDDIAHTAWRVSDPGFTDQEQAFETIQELVGKIRATRTENGFPPSAKLTVHVSATGGSDSSMPLIRQHQGLICELARLEVLRETAASQKSAREQAADLLLEIPFGDWVDLSAEEARIGKELAKLDKKIKQLSGKLKNEQFLAKAPDDVVQKNREEQADLKQREHTLKQQHQKLKELADV